MKKLFVLLLTAMLFISFSITAKAEKRDMNVQSTVASGSGPKAAFLNPEFSSAVSSSDAIAIFYLERGGEKTELLYIYEGQENFILSLEGAPEEWSVIPVKVPENCDLSVRITLKN